MPIHGRVKYTYAPPIAMRWDAARKPACSSRAVRTRTGYALRWQENKHGKRRNHSLLRYALVATNQFVDTRGPHEHRWKTIPITSRVEYAS
jgi:hypothetical protein